MYYTIVAKNESAAAAILYGEGIIRFKFELSYFLTPDKEDNYTSSLYVDRATFAKYSVGDQIYIGIDMVMAEPDNIIPILGADNATLDPPAYETEEPGLQPPSDLDA